MIRGILSFFQQACVVPTVRIAGWLIFSAVGIAAQESANWAVTTFAGQAGIAGPEDGLAGAAHFNGPRGIVADASGTLFVADTFNHTIRKISSGGQVSTFAGAAGQSGFADGSATVARFNSPTGLALDSKGNLYVADYTNNAIRKITPAGVASTLAGGGPTVAGSVDGTGAAAQFNQPAGVAIDASGNIYVADSGNSTIRKITPGGVVTTVAGPANSGQFANPYGVAVDSAGTLYVADTFNYVIQSISSSGVVTPFAGASGISGSVDGTSAAARFSGPSAIIATADGSFYLTESGNHDVRRISAGNVSVIAGIPGSGGVQDGTGNNALFSGPQGLTATADGTLYICDTLNSTIRKLTRAQGVAVAPTSRLSNISTRSFVGTGDNVMIAGFVIVGTAPKKVLIRASGPALGTVPALVSYGILADPRLDIYDIHSAIVAKNNDWGEEPTNAALVQQANLMTGTAWTNGSKDAALVETLVPGNYTAIVSGNDGGTGIAQIEVFELDSDPASRLINISTRSRVQLGDGVQIAGFIISGTAPKKVLIRAGGPYLTQFKVGGVLADPTIELHDANTVIGRNDNWSSDAASAAIIQQAFKSSGAVPYDNGSTDAALVMTLNPGPYTAIVSGKNGGQGVALIEVQEIP